MKKVLLIGIAFCALGFKSIYNDPWESKFLKVSKVGDIQYYPDEKGNIIPDFSRVGYHQGNRKLPEVKVVKTISPTLQNSQQVIQNAIDEVSKMPADLNGLRGSILLKKGTYKIPGSIHINTSGIILKGEGDDLTGTKLIATGKGQRSLITIAGTGSLTELDGSRVKIKDKFVNVGSFSFEVESAAGFKAGDDIVLLRPGTPEWITAIQMDKIEARKGTKQWESAAYDLHFERKIVSIKGNKITLDNPVMMEIDMKFGGGFIYKSSFKNRIKEVGIEDILFESEYSNDTDEDHGWIAVDFTKAENCWVKNITSRFFGYACVSLESSAKNITVEEAKCLDAKSIITGGRRYSFNNNGQQNLFMNLETTEGRHDYVTGAKTLGPNVFYNCKSSATHADIGPHHRWAVGTLFDNITTDGEINVQDRGNWGSGHGWSGVTQVLWNCKVKRATVQSPWASGVNYSIGTQGEKGNGRLAGRPDGIWENQNKPGLTPQSLYISQLRARLKHTILSTRLSLNLAP